MKNLLFVIFTILLYSTPSISAEKSDINGDGYISHDEWMTVGTRRLEKQFAYQDANKDNYLDKSEQQLIRLGSRINQSISANLNPDGSFSIDSVKKRAELFSKNLMKNKNKFSDYINEQIKNEIK